VLKRVLSRPDPAWQVEGAQHGNLLFGADADLIEALRQVSFVMVDGRVVKRDGAAVVE
jgi:hypothetical protein